MMNTHVSIGEKPLAENATDAASMHAAAAAKGVFLQDAM